jgi:hypothetical protein
LVAESRVHSLPGGDLAAVRREQVLLDHRRGAALVHDGDVGVPRGRAGLLLRRQLLVDLLRARVARAGADGAHLDARVQLLEARPRKSLT